MLIRTAQLADLPELLEIYNYEVLNGIATLDLTPQTYEQRQEWFQEHTSVHHPLICALTDGGTVAGYASLSPYRSKEAYSSTVELSVYVSPHFRRRGVATQLMEHILDMARADRELRTVVSVITSGNEASTRLHERFGFRYCGTIPDVAVKFGNSVSIDNFMLSVESK